MRQIVRVLDTETTGDGPTDQVCELAIVDVPGFRTFNTLVRPTVPMNVEARAVHHITDEELATAPPAEEIPYPFANWEIVAAHNITFDARLMKQSNMPLPERRICTWRCSMHLWPDAPSYKNQVLRYWLDLEVPGLGGLSSVFAGLYPHRALYDALVTGALVAKMLETHTVEELLLLTTEPVLLKTIRFGTHRGKLWEDVPDGYLRWILRQGQKKDDADEEGFDRDVIHTARHWIEARR
jgi:exodeoxyribonuclease X